MSLQAQQHAGSCGRRLVRAASVGAVPRVLMVLLLHWIELGTGSYPPEEQRRLKILNMFAALVFVATTTYAVQNAFMDFEKFKPIILINTALLLLALGLPLLHRFGPICAGLTLVLCEYAALVALSACLGRNAGLHLQFFVAAAASFVVLGPERLRLVLVVVAVGIVLHLAVWFAFPPEAALIPESAALADGLYLQAAIVTMGMITATVWYAFGLVEKARNETERLLRNILPGDIVERLKAFPDEPIADTFEDASVMFADIEGFVAIAHRLGARGVVDLLNRLVSAFDALAERHGLEKIKTIGDAYMAAAGVPVSVADHAERMVAMGLDMQRVLALLRAETGLPVRMRIGIASGPVMAGIIGRNKFSYDVWGDTVNLAARLEGIARPDRILICPKCREKVVHRYRLERIGPVVIAGLGELETWQVEV